MNENMKKLELARIKSCIVRLKEFGYTLKDIEGFIKDVLIESTISNDEDKKQTIPIEENTWYCTLGETSLGNFKIIKLGSESLEILFLNPTQFQTVIVTTEDFKNRVIPYIRHSTPSYTTRESLLKELEEEYKNVCNKFESMDTLIGYSYDD